MRHTIRLFCNLGTAALLAGAIFVVASTSAAAHRAGQHEARGEHRADGHVHHGHHHGHRGGRTQLRTARSKKGSVPANTALPTITGTAQERSTLSASSGSWSGPGVSYAYTWNRCDSAGNACTAISGATAKTYTATSADVGSTLRVTVTASNNFGSSAAISGATAKVASAPVVGAAPANTAVPTITGTAQEKSTLSASNGSWSDSPSSYAFLWSRCDGAGSGCAAISGATAKTYTATSADVGSTLRVTVTASNNFGSSAGTSAATASVSAAAVTSTTCGWGTFSATSIPGACWRPYSDSSPFNTPVAGKPTASNSDAVVSRLMTLSSAPDRVVTGNADTAGDWSHPIYYSQPSDPLYTVHCTETWGTCEIEGMQVRIPAQARPAGGSDGHMAVIDQQAGWEYDFWQVASKPSNGGTISISWGGRTEIGTASADGLSTNATAARFGLSAGIVRPSELAAGEIDHALFMVVKCTNGTSVYPAGSGTGSVCADKTNAPAMGQHFYLDMSDAQIDALSVADWQKTILRAMARYGLYVGDTGGGGWGIQFESGSSFTSFGQPDPWIGLGDQLGATKYTDPNTGRTQRIWDFRGAVNWGSNLKVAAP